MSEIAATKPQASSQIPGFPGSVGGAKAATGKKPAQIASPPTRQTGLACNDRGPGRSSGSHGANRVSAASVIPDPAAANRARNQLDPAVKDNIDPPARRTIRMAAGYPWRYDPAQAKTPKKRVPLGGDRTNTGCSPIYPA
jgi:hypothetical protein